MGTAIGVVGTGSRGLPAGVLGNEANFWVLAVVSVGCGDGGTGSGGVGTGCRSGAGGSGSGSGTGASDWRDLSIARSRWKLRLLASTRRPRRVSVLLQKQL